VEVIMAFLDKLDKHKLLTWQCIPQSEVWVKIGGDHGGKTFRLCFQVRLPHTTAHGSINSVDYERRDDSVLLQLQ